MKKTYCDGCGKEIPGNCDPNVVKFNVNHGKVQARSVRGVYDLCGECLWKMVEIVQPDALKEWCE